METRIPFAIRFADQRMVGVEEVPQGLACGCHCPSCHATLIARKGPKNIDHFAHHKQSGQTCEYAAETSIRLMLLSLLESITELNTPALSMSGHFPKKTTILRKGQSLSGLSAKLTTAHEAPQVIYSLSGNAKYNLALYLPPAGERNHVPAWLADYLQAHPDTGILGVDYRVILGHLFSRERLKGTDSLLALQQIITQQSHCLNWLYHPAEPQLRAQAAERARLAAEASAAMNEQSAERRRQAKTSSVMQTTMLPDTPPEQHGYCRHCHLWSYRLSASGYCDRPSCTKVEEGTQVSQQAVPSEQSGQDRLSPEAIKDYIRTHGERPEGFHTLSNERWLEQQDAEGNKEWLVLTAQHIWLVRMSASHSDWAQYNVRCSGGGRIGWRVPLDPILAAAIRIAAGDVTSRWQLK